MREKVQLSNNYPSWEDIFYDVFLKNGNLLYKIMKNVLFVIPHPDDEIVGSCILIKNFLRKQKVTLVFLTNGVISPNTNWFWKRKSYKKMSL